MQKMSLSQEYYIGEVTEQLEKISIRECKENGELLKETFANCEQKALITKKCNSAILIYLYAG